MSTKTAPSPAERLEHAKAAEQAAKDKLTELRERHMIGAEPVTAAELSEAEHGAELTELERQGAELAVAESERKERLAKLAEISGDISARAKPEGAVEAFEAAVSALTALILACGPKRTQMIERWRHQLRALGVQATRGGQELDAEDGGLGWGDVGWGGTPSYVIRNGRPIRGYDLAQLLAGIVASACRQAEVNPALLGVGHPPAALVEDPARWLS